MQLPRLVGKHQAFGPLFLGDPFDAATAFRMGLLSEVVPKGTALFDSILELIRRTSAYLPPDVSIDAGDVGHLVGNDFDVADHAGLLTRAWGSDRPRSEKEEGDEAGWHGSASP